MTDAAPRPTIADRLHPITAPLPGVKGGVTFTYQNAFDAVGALLIVSQKGEEATVTLPPTLDGHRLHLTIPRRGDDRPVIVRGLPYEPDGPPVTAAHLGYMTDQFNKALSHNRWHAAGAEILRTGQDAAGGTITSYAQVFSFKSDKRDPFKALVTVTLSDAASKASVTAPDLNVTIDLPVLHEPDPEVAVLNTTRHLLDLLAELAVRPTE